MLLIIMLQCVAWCRAIIIFLENDRCYQSLIGYLITVLVG